jgi:hypothetical protein
VPLAEAYDRLRPTPSLEIRSPRALLALERRLLVEEGRRYREARAAATDGRLVLADTGFAGPLTYARGLVALGLTPASVLAPLYRKARVLMREGSWGVADLTVYLSTSARTRRRRVAGDPRGHPASIAVRHEAVGRVERADLLRRIGPALGPRFLQVEAEGRPVDVARRIRTVLAGRPRGPAPRRLGEELLRVLAAAPPLPA